MKKSLYLCILTSVIGYALLANGQTIETPAIRVPSKLQLTVEPEEITLTKGITVGAPTKKIHLIVSETSGLKNARLELVARPFTEINTGDIVDSEIVTIDIATPQAELSPGGLQRVEVVIGGFKKAGSYLGGITIHDTVSGEQKEVSVRVSVKDSRTFPTIILLISILLASGVNYWTKKGQRKNRNDRSITELQKTIKLAGVPDDPFLFEAEQLLEKAQIYNQDYQFTRAETAIAETEQKLKYYEHRKQGSEQLRQRMQELLHDVRELGENDRQHTRINDELIRLLPTVQSEYEQTEALVKQIELFFRAYRLARKDLQTAREKLSSNLDFVKKADKSKIDMYFRDIEHLLNTAESMSTLDDANTLLRKVAYELSPEKINENIFREQEMQQVLSGYEQQVKQVTGSQANRIVTNWYEIAKAALEDNRYEDVDNALQKLESILSLVVRIKQVEQQVKGRDSKMTAMRRILRACKEALEEQASWDEIDQAEWDISQIEAILEGRQEQYEPFQPSLKNDTEAEHDESETSEAEAQQTSEDEGSEHLKRLTQEDLIQHVERTLEEAAKYHKLRGKIRQWRDHCGKLLQFEEFSDLSDYLRSIQDVLTLYARVQAIRAQAEEKHLHAVLKLIEQSELLLQQENQDELTSYHRAEVLTDAANGLLEEKQHETEFDQVLSYIRSPNTTSTIITYGTLSSYFIVVTILGLQILYAPDPDFGALVFKDYFSLLLWALGLEGAKMTVTNVYTTYFKKNS